MLGEASILSLAAIGIRLAGVDRIVGHTGHVSIFVKVTGVGRLDYRLIADAERVRRLRTGYGQKREGEERCERKKFHGVQCCTDRENTGQQKEVALMFAPFLRRASGPV